MQTQIERVSLSQITEEQYSKGKAKLEKGSEEMAKIWQIAQQNKGDIQIATSGGNLQGWTSPVPGIVNQYFGISKKVASIEVLPTAHFGTIWMFDQGEKLFREVLAHHRKGGMLSPSVTMSKLFTIVKQAFPGSKMVEDDFMFSCSEEQTAKFRKLMKDCLSERKGELKEIVQKEVKEAAESWAGKETVDASTEMQRLSSRIATRVFFGQSVGSEKLGEAATSINMYIQKVVTRQQTTQEDALTLMGALNTFKEEAHLILEKRNEIAFFQNSDLSDEEMKGMIFTIFFAGQETVAALSSYTLMELAKNPLKKDPSPKELHNLFVRSIHQFPPVHSLGRKLKECASFKILLSDGKEAELFMKKGDTIVLRIKKAAKHALVKFPEGDVKRLNYRDCKPFGGGVHRCPGETLAGIIVKELVRELSSKYDLEYVGKEPNPPAYHFTSKLTHPVLLSVQPKET